MKPLRPPHVAHARTPSPETLEELAAEILGFLAAEPERLRRFFDLTGLSPEALRQAAIQPGFVTSLLDHLAADDCLLIAFAADSGRDAHSIEALRQAMAPPADESF